METTHYDIHNEHDAEIILASIKINRPQNFRAFGIELQYEDTRQNIEVRLKFDQSEYAIQVGNSAFAFGAFINHIGNLAVDDMLEESDLLGHILSLVMGKHAFAHLQCLTSDSNEATPICETSNMIIDVLTTRRKELFAADFPFMWLIKDGKSAAIPPMYSMN